MEEEATRIGESQGRERLLSEQKEIISGLGAEWEQETPRETQTERQRETEASAARCLGKEESISWFVPQQDICKAVVMLYV